MIAALVRFSISYSGIVLILASLLLGYGGYRFYHAGLDIFPEFSPNQVTIQTESPGFSSEQVEVLITQPIENSIAGLIGMKSIRSESIQGLSIITAVFSDEIDIYHARQQVSERLTQLEGQLPETSKSPIVLPLSSSSATVLTIGLNSDSKSLMKLRSLVDWTIVPRLLTVPGVADVNVFGGEIKQLQIQIIPTQLRRFNLSVADIAQAVRRAGKIQGVGFLENSNQRFTLQVTGLPKQPKQFDKIIVKRLKGKQITLADVATIQFAPEPAIGAAQIMGKPGIVMMIIGQFGANTLTVSHAIEQVLEDFETIFSKQNITFYPDLFRPADYIETSFRNVSEHLLLGGLFVLIILYLFLYNFRTAVISALAIPLSLIGAILILLETGTNLNIMVLGGLAIALGEVVDDAIIDTENIFRRLRENQLVNQPQPIKQVIFSASMEVRSSVVYASFIVALVFVPLLSLSGVAGKLFAPLGHAYIIAIFSSLLIALTVTPALCFLLFGKISQKKQHSPLLQWLNPIYLKTLLLVFKNFKISLCISLILFCLALLPLFSLGGDFLPDLREGHYIVHTTSIPGTSLQESIRTGKRLTRQFLKISGVKSVSQWAGRAERGADTYGSHYSEFEIRLNPSSGSEQQQILEKTRSILEQYPGIVYEANTFLTERIDETISGYTAPVAINIYGNDLDALDEKARQVAAVAKTVAGAKDIQLRSPPGTSVIQIHLDLDKMALRGVQAAEVLDTIQAAYEGQLSGKIYHGNRFHNISVTLPPTLKKQSDLIGQLPVRTMDNTLIPLQEIAQINYTRGRYNILHQNAQRKQTITSNIIGRDVESFVEELKQRIFSEISFSDEIYPEFTGAAFEQSQARKKLIINALIAGIGVLILIHLAIGNFRHVLLTLVNLPFSLIGGVAAIILMGATLSIGSVVGFITLFGITVRNSIMLLSHYQYLISHEQKSWNQNTAIQGAQERLPSILMTALVTALAMAPIAFNSDNPGREIMGPMATIIIGGLISSTLLNLLLLPAILLRFGVFKK